MAVDTAAAKWSTSFRARGLFFCSAHCLERFRALPDAYVGEHVGPATASKPTGAAAYVCPMHPQIARDAPGSCPICGMALEPRVDPPRREDSPELLGTVNGRRVAIGNAKLLARQSIRMPGAEEANSKEAIEQLRAAGLRVVMLTGDNGITAKAVAKMVGIDEVNADVLPTAKAEVVRRLCVAPPFEVDWRDSSRPPPAVPSELRAALPVSTVGRVAVWATSSPAPRRPVDYCVYVPCSV